MGGRTVLLPGGLNAKCCIDVIILFSFPPPPFTYRGQERFDRKIGVFDAPEAHQKRTRSALEAHAKRTLFLPIFVLYVYYKGSFAAFLIEGGFR